MVDAAGVGRTVADLDQAVDSAADILAGRDTDAEVVAATADVVAAAAGKEVDIVVAVVQSTVAVGVEGTASIVEVEDTAVAGKAAAVDMLAGTVVVAVATQADIAAVVDPAAPNQEVEKESEEPTDHP